MNTHAETFRRLHEGGLLILPNVWDAGTARLVESAGAKALATTSAGVAWTHGYPDGNALDVGVLVAAVREIVRVVQIPVSVDAEGGYAADAAKAAENVGRLADVGAVGVNLEDGHDAPAILCAKIAAVKRRAPDVFVNARTDLYLKALVPAEERVAESLRRAQLYAEAGADGLFVPGVTDLGEIRGIAEGTTLPLNVLVRPSLPGARELEALGVRRLSAGSWITSRVYAQVALLAEAFLRDGISAALSEGARPYAEINALFARD